MLRCFGRGEIDWRRLLGAYKEIDIILGLKAMMNGTEEAVRVRWEVNLHSPSMAGALSASTPRGTYSRRPCLEIQNSTDKGWVLM